MRKRLWVELALCTSFLSYFSFLNAFPSDGSDAFLTLKDAGKIKELTKDDYTINFNNVSMLEFLRFASKLTNLNFVFDEADIQFTVSFISEEAVSPKNIMAAIAQVLRIHDLILLEQDGNVIITKSTRVHQVPPIISADSDEPTPANALIVTRIFRIKNGNINTIAGIIRTMVSDSAMIEISSETRQLIVTDIATNVEQIATLLLSLDTPHSPLDIDTYTVKAVSSDELITLTQQILAPFTEGNPLIFVPQKDTNAIFIVSTPSLIERALTVMEDLDVPPKAAVVGKGPLSRKNVYVYKAENLTLSELSTELKAIVGQMKIKGSTHHALEQAVESVKLAEDTNSMIFLTDDETAGKLKSILTALDTPITMRSTYLLYPLQSAAEPQISHALKLMKERLKSSSHPDEDLIKAIDTMRWNEQTNTLIFIGSPNAIKELKEILPTFDVPSAGGLKSTFLIYTPQYRSGEDLYAYLRNTEESLKHSGLVNSAFLQTLNSMTWNSSTNSLLFTGDPQSLERVQAILNAVESQHGKSATPTFFLYKLQNGEGDIVIAQMKEIASKIPATSLQNNNLINAIEKLQWIPANNSLLITGSPDAIEQIKALLVDFDIPAAAGSNVQDFFLYKTVSYPPEELMTVLHTLSVEMRASGLNDPALLQSLSSVRYVPATHSLLITGTNETLTKVKTLLSGIDHPTTSAQTVGNCSYLLYKLHTASPEQFLSAMKTFANEMQKVSQADQQLAQAINSMKYIPETNSVLFIGSEIAIHKVNDIASKLDIGALVVHVERAAPTFVIYNPKYLKGDELIAILCDFMLHLQASGVTTHGLFDAINNLQWLPKTSTLLISGDKESIDQVLALLQKFDLPSNSTPSIETFANTSFLVYKLQYHSGVEIQSALKQIAANLAKSATPNTILSEAIESVQWVQPTNSLIASGPQDVLVKLRELIQNIDVALRQVFIEVLVIQTGLTNIQNFGLQWGSQFQYFNKTIFQTGNMPAPPSATSGTFSPPNLGTLLQPINATSTPNSSTIPFSSGFDLGVIGDIIMHKGKSFISLGSLLNALQLDNDSTILTNQKIITQDNRQSTIFTGFNVPYTGSLVTNTQSNTTTTANIEYRDVGINLTITPILGENDIITLDVVQDLSAVLGGVSNANTSTTVLTGITTTHAHMETRVTVPDSKFLVLSGVITDSKTRFRTGIPCLGSLPVVGALFSENDRTDAKQNIVIFLRPKIINSFEDYKQVTERQEWLYKDQARLPALKEDFEEALDTIKLPEDE